MAGEALRAMRAIVSVPRQPLRRVWWFAMVLGPVLALTVAAIGAMHVAMSTLVACSDRAGCASLAALASSGYWPVVSALGLGGVLGVLRARGGVTARLAMVASILLVGGLPWLPLVLLPSADRGLHLNAELTLVVEAAIVSVVALGLFVVPNQVATGLLATADQERRRWWQASLRASRLTRRTLGLGIYRQLCRTGFVRVLSAVYPGRVYLVPRRTSPSGARVLVEERGQVIGGLCLRPREPLPDPEEVVAHVLWLRGDERAYLAAANFFPYDTVLTPQATARRL